MTLSYSEMSSAVGTLKIVADESAVVAILLEGEEPGRVRLDEYVHRPNHPILLTAERELGEYFAGERRTFDLPLRPTGTAFQQRVWQCLRQIPYGECWSYSDVARSIGQPSATRAVGGACGRNPICIVVPCHRVIGQNGKLTGFAGGLEVKMQLLAMETRVENRCDQQSLPRLARCSVAALSKSSTEA